MSDKISGFVVTFKKSVSEEYMDKIKSAIEIFDGVVKVEPVVEGIDTYLGASQENMFIRKQLIELVTTDFGRNPKN